MNSKQRRTLAAVFADPVSGTMAWSDLEALLVAAGCRRLEGAGSRVKFVHGTAVASFHRPHPGQGGQTLPGARRARVSDADRSDAVSNSMTHRGYAARIDYDDEDGLFHGRIAGIADVVGFHADTVAGLREAFVEAVDDYLDTCAALGKDAQRPYSGNVMFRVSPEVHRRAAIAAELAGKSLNQWAAEVLTRAAG